MDDGKQGYDPSPVNPLPPLVLVLFLVLFAIETVLAGGEVGYFGGPSAVGWRLNLIEQYGFSPQIFAWMIETGRWPTEHLMRLLTYPFLHFGFIQMVFSGVFILAMGKMVGEAMGSLSVAAIFFGSTVTAALVYGLLPGETTWLVGAMPGAYGLIGGFTFVLWARARLTGGNQSQAFYLIAMLMGIQLLFGLLFGSDNTWVADLAGFVAGFALCFVLVSGARRALLRRLRQE